MRGAGALERIKTLGTDYMLNAAGVPFRRFRVYAGSDQPVGKKTVLFVDPLHCIIETSDFKITDCKHFKGEMLYFCSTFELFV